MVANYRKTGTWDHQAASEGRYGDFENVGDYLTAMDRVSRAQQSFAALPSEVRDHCENDPAVFLEWALDPANAEEMRELGIGELADVMHGPETETPPPSEPAVPAPAEAPAEPPVGGEEPEKGS